TARPMYGFCRPPRQRPTAISKRARPSPITPSMAGGEPVRIHLLRRNGLSLGQATASVLGERLLDAIFILLLVPFAFFLYKDRIDIGFIQVGLSIGIVVFIVGIILFLYAIKNPEQTKSIICTLNYKIRKIFKRKEEGSDSFVAWINTEVDNFHDSMIFFIKKGRRAFLSAGFITILFWSTGFLIPSMILLGLGLPPFFLESYAAQVLLIVIVMMPTTPGSSGVAEGGVAALYSVLIGSSYSYLLGVFVLLFRFITFHMNLIVGGIFQYHIFRSVASFSVDTLKKDT
ncbi:MAG: flippase-like domain-containing protein, partial [Candidatus Thermoplasmatota archaeon]|nr:flippase-like domain-containing protein [Candidatus Thermoplasmatota archaeon]